MKEIGRAIPPPSDVGGETVHLWTTGDLAAELGSTTKSMEGKEQWISLRASGSITSV